ncbi:MAG: DNA-binding SARP family transcriptional activator [Ilumatobacter sp.]|jgi:DNA-binding SARP family transcriptional activator
MLVELLGPPTITDQQGEKIHVRGKKTWGLIARILLTDAPVSRRRLAEELYATANDPMGALRWALAQIRRSIGDPNSFRNDPVEANLGPSLQVDVLHLDQLVVNLLEIPGQLLEGVDVAWSAEFDVWLSVERWRAASQVEAALHTATMQALTEDDGTLAASYARELVARAPLEESGHILLVKSLVVSGDGKGARDRVAACEHLFEVELGIRPSLAVALALRTKVVDRPPGVSHKSSALTLLEAGTTAVDAGAIDAGIECLRQAVAEAEASKDEQLYGKCQGVLGSALIHGIRGFDDEGSLALHSAVESAVAASDPATAAMALMELGYVELLAGRRNAAAGFLERAGDAAAELPELQSSISSFKGTNLADWGRFGDALVLGDESIESAERSDSQRDRAWAMTFKARTLMGLHRYDEARLLLVRSLPIAIEEKWLAFRPLIEILLLELDRLQGRDHLQIRADLELVFAGCCQLADPCWEGLAARGIGLTYQCEVDSVTAYGWLNDAVDRCTRVTDTWMWVEAWVLESEVELAIGHGHLDHARLKGQQLLHHSATKQLDYHADLARDLLSGMAVRDRRAPTPK